MADNDDTVSRADHRTLSGDDAKLYGQTRQELGKSSWIAATRNGFKKPKSTAQQIKETPPSEHGRTIIAPSAAPAPKPKPGTGFGRVIMKHRVLVGKKVGISAQKAKPASVPPKAPAPQTHVAGVQIPPELHEHFHAGNVVPHEHPLREKAAEFVTNVWRHNVPEGKRMSLKLLGIGEEPAQQHPNAKPGYATIKSDEPMDSHERKNKLKGMITGNVDGPADIEHIHGILGWKSRKKKPKVDDKKLKKEGMVPAPPTQTATAPPLQEKGKQVQQALSGGLPEKTGMANVAQEIGALFGKSEKNGWYKSPHSKKVEHHDDHGTIVTSSHTKRHLALDGADKHVGWFKNKNDAKAHLKKLFVDVMNKEEMKAAKAPKAPKPVNHIKDANEKIKPLMHDIQKGFDKVKEQIHLAIKTPNDPKSAEIINKFKVNLDPKKGTVKGDNHSVMRHAVEQEYLKNPDRFIPRITEDNSKLKNEAIGCWTTPAVITCPGAGPCKVFCFAKNDQVQYKNSLAKRFVNMFSRKNPNFEKHINEQIESMRKKAPVEVKDWEKPFGKKLDAKGRERPAGYMPLLDETGAPVKRSWNTFRIHDSGDFDSPEEATRWRNIVAKNPDITFYAYTKSYSQPKIWETLKGMHKEFPNFKIIQSVGGRQDEKIDPNMPHAVIFENDAQLARAKYVASHNYDSRAADKNNRDVGLVIFGGGRKKYGNLRLHLQKAHGVRDKLQAFSDLSPDELIEPQGSAIMPEVKKSEAPTPGAEWMQHTLPDSVEAEQTLQPDSSAQSNIEEKHRHVMTHRAKLRRFS